MTGQTVNAAQTAQNTGAEATNVTTTLKIVSSKVHLGPKNQGLKAKTNLSSATGKVLFNNNLKVVVGNGQNQPVSNSGQSSNSMVINLNVGTEGRDAAYYLLAWDYLFKIGTDAYLEKFEALQQARTKAYQELGISNPGSDRPELTAQQREVYNAKVRPYAFTYFEYKLSFKQPGKKAVRSKTYRSLKPMDMISIQKQLLSKAKALSKDIRFGVRQDKKSGT